MASTDSGSESKTQHTSHGILAMPVEILLEIAGYLDDQEHSLLSRTCQHMAWTLQYALFKRNSSCRPKDCTDPTIIEAHLHMEYACEGRRYYGRYDNFTCQCCGPVCVTVPKATIEAIINRAVAFGLPASINTTINRWFEPPILVAVQNGNLSAVNHLISLGADLEYVLPFGGPQRTALAYAVSNINAYTGLEKAEFNIRLEEERLSRRHLDDSVLSCTCSST
ncbi:hypothetical protein DL546_009155 [Coniochaeta pulveracea]|uniref:F-box domain-containing protein n=1 Tax=Coniochaeta pulveracea TaxID=177199 RepID=A0A420YNV6_9PEZI|nr:hypothetical protein DL546_009155 [Coniochaeta pulveracea]